MPATKRKRKRRFVESLRQQILRRKRTKVQVLKRRIKRLDDALELAEAKDLYWFMKTYKTPISSPKFGVAMDRRKVSKMELNLLILERNEVQEMLDNLS